MLADGLIYYPSYLSLSDQESLVGDIREITRQAPLYTPITPGGGKFSVRMTNAGVLGWYADRGGYRYQPTHPQTGEPWPKIPESLLSIWQETVGDPRLPEACLINYYGSEAKMGLHQDRDEEALEVPVLSISLGDSGRFLYSPTRRLRDGGDLWLNSGDVLVLSKAARLYFHGIGRIKAGSGPPGLLEKSGRLNLTLRRVNR